VTSSVLTLDRATLTLATAERQWLSGRRPASATAAIEHLVGLQAQEPHEPYVGLWSRLDGFEPEHLVDLLERRLAVRTLMMRRTIHLHTSADALAMRPAYDAMLRQRMQGTLGPRLPGVDFDELAALGEPHFAAQPQILADVARAVSDRFPGAPVRDLGDALSTLVRLIQVPPRGLWGRKAPALNTTYAAWLGSDPDRPDEEQRTQILADIVRRYLRAFGPAASADLRAWSGLSGLPAVIKQLEPELTTYRDERGRTLLDLADASLPADDLPLPARFLPAFDNVVLGFDDRSRVIDDEHRRLSILGTRFVLVAGRVAGSWTGEGTTAGVTVTVEPLRRLSKAERAEVADEGQRLAGFLGDGRDGRLAWA
jgi:hypothetical protein